MTPVNIPSNTVGAFEYVSFPDLGVPRVLAKVDTGAYSGAIHCTKLKVAKRFGKKPVLKFIPLGKAEYAAETTDFTVRYLRSSTGHRVRRFLIKTTIEMEGKRYPVEIGLSDRADMRVEVLVGRRFLRDNGLVVDSRINKKFYDKKESDV
jgi:hypothetical protein